MGNMKKPAKILLGILTAWPVVYMFMVFGFMFLTFTSNNTSFFPIIFGLHFATIFMMFGLIAFYIVDVFRNKRIKQDQKALWAVVIFCGNMIAMPVYWYLFIWREPDVNIPAAQTGTPFKFCPQCGVENKEYVYCINCGRLLSE